MIGGGMPQGGFPGGPQMPTNKPTSIPPQYANMQIPNISTASPMGAQQVNVPMGGNVGGSLPSQLMPGGTGMQTAQQKPTNVPPWLQNWMDHFGGQQSS